MRSKFIHLVLSIIVLFAVTTPVVRSAEAYDYIGNLNVGTYALSDWTKLAGSAQVGGGLFLEAGLTKNVFLRLSGEATRWQPNDYFIDRGYIELVGYLPLSANADLYGKAGFGYGRGEETVVNIGEGRHGDVSLGHDRTEDVLARAGGGVRFKLFQVGKVQTRLFLEGNLFGSTSDRHGASLAGGLSIGK